MITVISAFIGCLLLGQRGIAAELALRLRGVVQRGEGAAAHAGDDGCAPAGSLRDGRHLQADGAGAGNDLGPDAAAGSPADHDQVIHDNTIAADVFDRPTQLEGDALQGGARQVVTRVVKVQADKAAAAHAVSLGMTARQGEEEQAGCAGSGAGCGFIQVTETQAAGIRLARGVPQALEQPFQRRAHAAQAAQGAPARRGGVAAHRHAAA